MAGVEAGFEGNTTLDVRTVDTQDDDSLSNILLPAATLLFHLMPVGWASGPPSRTFTPDFLLPFPVLILPSQR